MFLMVVSKNKKMIQCVNGEDKNIRNPIRLELVLDESSYYKVKEAAHEKNLHIYKAISMMFNHADEFIQQL